MTTCPAEFITLAHRLADAARPIALKYFRCDNGVEIKDDATPVTIADRDIEQLWRDMIMQAFPTHGIWGEEFGRHQPDADYQWILDPIDGTHTFALGRTLFGCLIALHHKTDGFILGLCDQPVTQERWFGATDYPTTYNNQPLPQRVLNADTPLRASITNPMRLQPPLQNCHAELVKQKSIVIYGGNCLNFAAIADGSLDVSFENKQSIYDIAPFVPMYAGVGAVVTQADGHPIDFDMGDSILACATPQLHARLVKIAQSV